MTAVTDSPAAARGGGPLSQGGPKVVRSGLLEGRSATAARPVPGPRQPVPATGAQSGRTPVAGAPESRSAAADSDGPATTLPTTVSQLSPQVKAAPLADDGDTLNHGEPVAATVVEGGAGPVAVAYVDGLDGAERKLLLNHIAQRRKTRGWL